MIINNTENVQPESLLGEECVDDNFTCSVCSVSYTSQRIVEEHFLTHIDKDFFFSNNTDIKREPRHSSPLYLNFNKNKPICTSQPSCNKNIPVHMKKTQYNKQLSYFTSYSKNNDTAQIKCEIRNKRKICYFCDTITYGEKNYRQHALIHYTKTGKLR